MAKVIAAGTKQQQQIALLAWMDLTDSPLAARGSCGRALVLVEALARHHLAGGMQPVPTLEAEGVRCLAQATGGFITTAPRPGSLSDGPSFWRAVDKALDGRAITIPDLTAAQAAQAVALRYYRRVGQQIPAPPPPAVPSLPKSNGAVGLLILGAIVLLVSSRKGKK